MENGKSDESPAGRKPLLPAPAPFSSSPSSSSSSSIITDLFGPESPSKLPPSNSSSNGLFFSSLIISSTQRRREHDDYHQSTRSEDELSRDVNNPRYATRGDWWLGSLYY
ncbi:hypothetical protein DM860_003871 [Cuscuta australis]|uniref:Uncharacterized protein n=1 Tax=Cuscuta australis TaxID=267555 RepID=A0A328CY41_9ASTE|nr:hypothetical protein DM860_003871 [Cuscuta australis]